VSLRVLSVAYPFAPVGLDAVGGAEVVLARLDAGLVDRSVASTVIACAGSRVRGRLRSVPIPPGTIEDPTRAEAWRAHRAAIDQAIDSERPDVIHLHGLDFTSYLPDRRIPILVTLHLPLDWYAPDTLELEARGVRFVCVSTDQRQRGGVRWSGVQVIENGVPIGGHEERGPARGDFGLCLGRICPEKGFHLALEAARRADVPLLLAGEVHPYPAHQRYFAQHIAPLLDGGRRFIGAVAGPAKRRLLGRARFLAVPSLAHETSSLVAMEALAAGTPVVAHRVGALPEIVEPGRTGWLVDDVDGLARAFLDTDHLQSEQCRAAARTRFDAERMVGEYLSLYRALTREAPSLAAAAAPSGADRAARERLAST
jgi:glycosyltransferase involved in cell wall biosynthesis